MKASGAKLVWASTTPLIGTKGDSLYEPGSEVIYNAIAARVMKGAGIPINDMHAWVLKNLPKHKEPFLFRKVPIQEPMVGSITRVLKLD